MLEKNLTFIVSNGGHPQFIAALVIQNKEVFEVLASVPDNGLTGTQKLFYDINTDCGDWNKLYEGAIDPSHYVRNHLLHMCRNGEIEDSSISERIIDIMKKDANYAIREFANS